MENRLGRLVNRPEGVFLYGIYDAMSAKMAELAGIEAIYVGGYSAAGSRGWPDMGLLAMTEMLEHVKPISRFVKSPCMIDIDDGYGNVNNVERTVTEFIRLPNVEALHMEDQKYPKRCGHISGKEIVPIQEFLGKLRMAITVRDEYNPGCAIIARTDAFSAAGGRKDSLGGNTDEAVKRLIAYADIGADYLWCEFPNASLLTAAAVAERVRKVHPKATFAFNISPSFSQSDWNRSLITETALNDYGYKLRFATYPALQDAMLAVYKSAKSFIGDATDGMRSLKNIVHDTPAEVVNKVLGVDGYLAREREFYPQGKDNQSTSEGFGEVKK